MLPISTALPTAPAKLLLNGRATFESVGIAFLVSEEFYSRFA
jgi:hypothetical protein